MHSLLGLQEGAEVPASPAPAWGRGWGGMGRGRSAHEGAQRDRGALGPTMHPASHVVSQTSGAGPERVAGSGGGGREQLCMNRQVWRALGGAVGAMGAGTCPKGHCTGLWGREHPTRAGKHPVSAAGGAAWYRGCYTRYWGSLQPRFPCGKGSPALSRAGGREPGAAGLLVAASRVMARGYSRGSCSPGEERGFGGAGMQAKLRGWRGRGQWLL